MTGLGNIYEPEGDGPKGRDLRYTVPVNRALLGAPLTVEVPLDLPIDGEIVPRAIGVGEKGVQVSLNLPDSLPDGATIRLRKQGEEIEDGEPGDLYLTVTLMDPPGPQAPYGGWWVAGAVLVLSVIAWIALK
jgi:hypothetical protein